MAELGADCRADDTPPDVDVQDHRPPNIGDPTLAVPLLEPIVGLPVVPADPKHKLVTLGDSITHGLISGAVYATHLSWPAMAAAALGIPQFTYPKYAGPLDGLPLNLEALVRKLQDTFGDDLNLLEKAGLPLQIARLLERNEDFWERGKGSNPPPTGVRYHNLAIYGWDVRDALSFTRSRAEWAATRTKDDLAIGLRPNEFLQGLRPEADNDIAAWSVLAPFRAEATELSAAAAHGEDGGIETLVVVLGSNNALGAVVGKEVKWTTGERYKDVTAKGDFNVCNPTHFEVEYEVLVEQVKRIRARRVVLATVPHVTIAPIAKGVNPERPGQKWRDDDGVIRRYR